MSYCENCGQQYSGSKNYCRRCGQSLAGNAGTMYADTGNTASTVELGILRAHNQIASSRRARDGSNESLDLYLRCVAVIGFIHGLSFLVGPGLGNMLNGALGWVLAAAIVLAVVCKTMYDMRYGDSLTRSLLGTLVAGIVVYGVLAGGMWYLSTYLHSMEGKPLFVLNPFPTTTPHALPTRAR